MTRTSLVPFAASLAALPLLAQDPAAGEVPELAPAQELQRYAPLLGHWEGAGDYTPAPGAAAIAWTAKESAQWTLGNHIVEVRTHVQFQGQVPPLTIRSFYGYDKERKQHVLVAANSFGQCYHKDVHWGQDGELILVSAGREEGAPYSAREVIALGKDGFEFKIESASGTGPFMTKVKGSFRRAGKEVGVAEAAFSDPKQPAMHAAPQGELAKLARMCGSWRLTGSMTMMPGTPAMPIAGTESIDSDWGGRVLLQHIVGDASPEMGGVSYEAWGFVGWNAERGCYRHIFASNMGEIGEMSARWVDADNLAFTAEGSHMGMPTAVRGILTFTKDARSPMRFVSDRLLAGHPPLRDFEASYAPAK